MDLGPVADREPSLRSEPLRRAAVLVPVFQTDSGPHVLFIKRSNDLAEHPGEMSFPGGGAEPRDRDRLATAVREAGEEVGLGPEEITTVGQLDDIQTVSGYAVRPFVARIPDRPYEPTDAEVEQVVPLSVGALTTPENHGYEFREHPEDGTIPCHHFYVDGYTIWGATARMLVQLLSLGTDWSAPDPPAIDPGE